jgi:hypothetical protein
MHEHLEEPPKMGPVVRTYYRALVAGTRELWCESRNPGEVLELSKRREVVLEKLEVYEVSSGWGKWDGSV